MAVKLRNQTNDNLLNTDYISLKVLKELFRHWSNLESMSRRGDRIATDILLDLKRITGIDTEYYDRHSRKIFDKRYELGILSYYQYISIAYVLVLGYLQEDVAHMMDVDQSVIAKNIKRGLTKVIFYMNFEPKWRMVCGKIRKKRGCGG